jgi:hypothetical protein
MDNDSVLGERTKYKQRCRRHRTSWCNGNNLDSNLRGFQFEFCPSYLLIHQLIQHYANGGLSDFWFQNTDTSFINGNSRGFPQSLQTNFGIATEICRERFLPHSFQFIIH